MYGAIPDVINSLFDKHVFASSSLHTAEDSVPILPSAYSTPLLPKKAPAPKPPSDELHDVRNKARYEDTIHRLQMFVNRHKVYVYAASYPDVKAHLTTLSVNKSTSHTQSAISMMVFPPAELQELFYLVPRPDVLIGAGDSEQYRMHLSTFMRIVLTWSASITKRMYDDVQCEIHWNGNATDTTTIPLSQWIPTKVLFAQFAIRPSSPYGSLTRYKQYLTAATEDKFFFAVFKQADFQKLYSLPSTGHAVVPVSGIVPVKEVIETITLTEVETPEVMDDDIKMDVCEQLEEESIHQSLSQKRRRQELPASTRILRKRVLSKEEPISKRRKIM